MRCNFHSYKHYRQYLLLTLDLLNILIAIELPRNKCYRRRLKTKSLESQGGDLVQESSKWDYVRVMSERYQNGCRKEKRLILDELKKKFKSSQKKCCESLELH